MQNENQAEAKLLRLAQKEVGIREQSGKNGGKRVEEYLHYVNLPKGAPWCAAFVSWVYGQAGYKQPKTGWSPALFPMSKRKHNIKPAMVFGIYFPELKRIAHCGLVEQQAGSWIITIEGNTNTTASREGDGVYRKRRVVKAVKYFASWVLEKGNGDES